MPTEQEWTDEVLELRRTISRQQLLISNQRARDKQTKIVRLGLVAGQYADQVDPSAEADKVREFMGVADEDFQKVVTTLRWYADRRNYVLNATSLSAPVMDDKGAKAMEALKLIS